MSSEVRWTSGTLMAIVEKYLVKNKLSTAEIRQIINSNPKNEILSKAGVLKILGQVIEKVDKKLESYGPPQELLEDLEVFVDFPNNTEFIGLGSNCMNYYEKNPKVYTDQNGDDFISKNEVFLRIYADFSAIQDDGDEVVNSLLMSWGNRICRRLKKFYEFVPCDDVEEVWRTAKEILEVECMKEKTGSKKTPMPLSKFNVDELCPIFAKFFDSEFDGQLLEQLKSSLTKYNKVKPIVKNLDFYEKILSKHVAVDTTLKRIYDRFPQIFQPYIDTRNNVESHYAVVRVFEDMSTKFFIVRDLDYAIRVALKNRKMDESLAEGILPMETTEEKKNGFLNTITLEEYHKIVEDLKLNEDDIHIVSHKIVRTKRNVAVPIISHSGSHYKLAIDAFSDIFENLTFGIRLFETMKNDELPNIDSWFEQLDLIKDAPKKRFFVELWKINELVEKAYKDLKKFATEEPYEVPKKTALYNRNEAMTEVQKISKSTKLDEISVGTRFFYHVKSQGTPYLMLKSIYQIYGYCTKAWFLGGTEKLNNFVCNQGVCRNYRGFYCYCNISMESFMNRMAENNFQFIEEELEILSAEHVEANYIKYLDTFKYSLVAENGSKFYDNDTCFHKTLDMSLVTLDKEDQELVMLVYQEEAKVEREGRRIFYMSGEEVKAFVQKSVAKFKKAFSKINSADDDNSIGKVMKFNDIWDALRELFPTDDTIFEKMKLNLKKHPSSTKHGIPSKIVSKIIKKYKKARYFYQKCFEHTKSLTEFSKILKNRKTILRMVSEMRIKDKLKWDVFVDEVIEALEVNSRRHNGVHTLMDLVEVYESGMYNLDTFSSMRVENLKNLMRLVSLKGSLMFVPDIQVTKNLVELPLKMGYGCMSVYAPNGELAYDKYQAQFLLFQNTACDIDLNMEQGECCKHGNCTNHWKQEVIQMLKDVPEGYVPASKIEEIIYEMGKDDIVHASKNNFARTPLIQIHNSGFNQRMSRKAFTNMVAKISHPADSQTNVFLRAMGFENPENIEYIELWRVKYVFMVHWIFVFLKDEHNGLQGNILIAWTVCLAHLKLEKIEDLEEWMKKGPNGFDMSRMEKCVENLMKNEENNFRFKETDLMQPHRWDTRNAMPESMIKSKIQKNTKKSNKKGMSNEKIAQKMREDKEAKKGRTSGETVILLFNNIMNFLPDISEENFAPIENLGKLIETKLFDVLEKYDVDWLHKLKNNEDSLQMLKTRFESFIEFKVDTEGKTYYKRKPLLKRNKNEREGEIREKIEVFVNQSAIEMYLDERKDREIFKQLNKQARKKDALLKSEPPPPPPPKKSISNPPKIVKEIEQIVTKYVTETKIIEFCEKCNENREEMQGISRRNESLEKMVEDLQKKLEEKEADNVVLKSQITESKTKYRKEIQNHKEDVTSRETRIQQLQQELKENRDDLRVERETLYTEVKESSRLANENVKKMKNELENMKFMENNKTRQIVDLMSENEKLKTEIEILEENQKDSEKLQSLEEQEELRNAQNSEIVELREHIRGLEDILAEFQTLYIAESPPAEQKLSDYETIVEFDVMGKVNCIMDRFIAMSQEPMTSEVSSFKRKFEMYMRILKDADSDSAKIPDFPMPFSADFMAKFEMFEKLEPVEQVMLQRNKCLLCSKSLGFRKKRIVNCQACFTVYHTKCVSWLGINTRCPVCESPLNLPILW